MFYRFIRLQIAIFELYTLQKNALFSSIILGSVLTIRVCVVFLGIHALLQCCSDRPKPMDSSLLSGNCLHILYHNREFFPMLTAT